MTSSTTEKQKSRVQTPDWSKEAEAVDFVDDFMSIRLRDGREIRIPVEWFPRLRDATPEERNNWRLMGNGEGIHWPDLDEDLSVPHLLLGR